MAKAKKKEQHGGARRGAGRPPNRGETRSFPVNVWLELADRDALDVLAESAGVSPALYAHDLLSPAIRRATARKQGAAKRRKGKRR